MSKIALVTGGSRGIGKAISLALAKDGYYVFVNYRSREEEALTVISEIKASGGQGQILQGDISSQEDVQTMFKTIEEVGTVDVLVNNAGITKDQLMLRMKAEDFDAVIDVNLKGAFYCTKQVTRAMFKKRRGHIINISSVIGLVGNVGQVNYSASKAGLIGMTKSLAKEYAARNIRVNAIAPGYIVTDMTENISEDVQKALLDKIPLKELGQPEDIANMVSFLVSDKAKYVTGQVIAVDGGMTM